MPLLSVRTSSSRDNDLKQTDCDGSGKLDYLNHLVFDCDVCVRLTFV